MLFHYHLNIYLYDIFHIFTIQLKRTDKEVIEIM
jgi:hypothetical protein